MTAPASQPQQLPIDYLECARMDIHGNSVALDNTLYVRLDDVDAVIDTLKAERVRFRPHTPAPCPQHKIWQHCPVAATIRNATLDELIETIKEDFTEDFDGDLIITYGDFLFNVKSL